MWRMAAGIAWSDPDDLVFTDKIGGSISPSGTDRRFYAAVYKAGLSGHESANPSTFAVEMRRAAADHPENLIKAGQT